MLKHPSSSLGGGRGQERRLQQPLIVIAMREGGFWAGGELERGRLIWFVEYDDGGDWGFKRVGRTKWAANGVKTMCLNI